MQRDVLYFDSGCYLSTLTAQAQFKVEAKVGRLTLECSSVAVEVVSTTGEGRADGDTVTGGKVHSEERATTENDKARSEVPDTASSLWTTAEKPATRGSQAGEVEMGKRSTEGNHSRREREQQGCCCYKGEKSMQKPASGYN